MPNLERFREFHYDATNKVSENTRTLALAAIAIVWLFNDKSGQQYLVPQPLRLPLLFAVAALAFDFLQHFYRSFAWHLKFRAEEGRLEKGKITEETPLYVSGAFNWVPYGFYYIKVLLLFAAYWTLIRYLLAAIHWT